MDVEREIISYLCKYGDTKESDIINYGIKKLKYSSEGMKRNLNRMTFERKIHHIVHSELEPPQDYVSLKGPLPPEITKILIEAQIQVKTLVEETREILEEAASLAKGRKKNTAHRFD